MADKLRRNKHIYITFTFFIAFLVAFSCDTQIFNFNINCEDCYTSKPDSADLIVKITINEENKSVPLKFFRGKVEEGLIEWIDTAYTSTLYLYSPVDEFYSVKAFYKKDGKTIIAIDGDKMKTSLVTDVCETDCWIIKGGILDVRLK